MIISLPFSLPIIATRFAKFPLDGTKFHPNGPGPSRALDPLFDAAVSPAPNA